MNRVKMERHQKKRRKVGMEDWTAAKRLNLGSAACISFPLYAPLFSTFSSSFSTCLSLLCALVWWSILFSPNSFFDTTVMQILEEHFQAAVIQWMVEGFICMFQASCATLWGVKLPFTELVMRRGKQTVTGVWIQLKDKWWHRKSGTPWLYTQTYEMTASN